LLAALLLMDKIKLKVLFSVAEFIVQAILMVAVSLIVMIDTLVIGNGTKEISITEITQEALILSSAILFGIGAWQRPNSRGFLVLVAGLFGCMFIRECDFFLNRIASGFWVYPAVLLAAAALVYSIRSRDTIARAMILYVNNKFFVHISIGLLIVLVFSRLLGTGHLWEKVMGDNYDWMYKTIIQESLELLGYMLISYGSVLFHFQKEVAHSSDTLAKGDALEDE
jgi:hypothetical protein